MTARTASTRASFPRLDLFFDRGGPAGLRFGAGLDPGNRPERGRAHPVHLRGVVVAHHEGRESGDDRAEGLRVGDALPEPCVYEGEELVRPGELPRLDA